MKRIEITLTLAVPQDMTPAAVYHHVEALLDLDDAIDWKIISGSAKEEDA